MRKTFYPMLLASALLPLSALAQTAPSADTTQPTVQSPDTMGGTGATANDPAASTGMMPSSTAGTGSMQSEGPFVTVPSTGAWRVSDLEGKQVYGAEGESIGDIKDVLVNQQGDIAAVLVGVGGFLGIGEKDVAVSMDALQLRPGMTQREVSAVSGADMATGVDNPAATGDMAQTPTGGTAQTPAAGTGMGDTATTEPLAGSQTPPTGAVGTTPGVADPGTAGNAGYGTMADSGMAVDVGSDNLPERIVLNVTRQQLEDAPAFEGVDAATDAQ